VRSAIHRFKYGGKGGYAKYFGYEMARFADYSDVPFVDFVVPVPIHRKRMLTRGYNQCELLAEVFAKERDEVCINLLERVKNTRPQSGLKKSQREQNIKGAFALSDIGIDIKGKNIMVIDDIFTTGSTMDECAKVLKKHGAAHVYAMCLSIRVQD
jgi:ComF family protein